jgi:hypothetical protein
VNVAYLITAYHQPRHLARLVQALDCSWARFVIHVDAKVDIVPFISALPPCDRVTFLPDKQRVDCHWGGFGLVQASLNLIREATRREGGRLGRYCLLSGSDFPIKSIGQLHAAFCSNREYLSVDREAGKRNANSHFDRRVSHYHFRDHPWLMRAGLSGRIPRLAASPIRLYVGSGWWSLTEAAIRFALDFIDQHPWYMRHMRYVDIPDETFFTTLVKASPFSANIVDDFEDPPSHDPLHSRNTYGSHYIDWRAGGSHPKVLTLADLPLIAPSAALFARKFEEPQSAQLLQAIRSPVTLAAAAS